LGRKKRRGKGKREKREIIKHPYTPKREEKGGEEERKGKSPPSNREVILRNNCELLHCLLDRNFCRVRKKKKKKKEEGGEEGKLQSSSVKGS